MLSNEGWDTHVGRGLGRQGGLRADAWTAEFRIPLSQLRYGPQDVQVWGMHSWRWIDRFQEESQWNLIPRQGTGRLYNFGELHGIQGLKPRRRIELLPHVLSQVESLPDQAGNPYVGTNGTAAIGLDAKVGLASNFTMDATVNPDFGQVEADPSVVNLTTYETFYEEKRPFFLEGKRIFTSAWRAPRWLATRAARWKAINSSTRDGSVLRQRFSPLVARRRVSRDTRRDVDHQRRQGDRQDEGWPVGWSAAERDRQRARQRVVQRSRNARARGADDELRRRTRAEGLEQGQFNPWRDVHVHTSVAAR